MLLVIPADRRLDWKSLPLLTIFLILVNALVHVLYQSSDAGRFEGAIRYYMDSGLASQELEHYLVFPHKNGQQAGQQVTQPLSEAQRMTLLGQMQRDEEFQRALDAEQIVTPEAEDYPTWKQRRQEFERQLHRMSIYKGGLIPASPRPWQFLSSAFLHGGADHLIGNMVFLFIIGCALERSLGSLRYGITYLVTALGGGALHVLTHLGDTTPSVGASGAIAGLMGCFAVYFGLRRIQFFYWLGFYMGYVRLPALIMLPVWVGKELLDAMLSADSQIAYFDHVGGLMSGGALALLWRRNPTEEVEPAVAAQGQVRPPDDYARALGLIDALRFDEAKALLNAIIAREPGRVEALQKLYNLEKLLPGSEPYHALARRIFQMHHKRADVDALVYATFQDYRERAQPKAKFSAEVMQLLAARFLRCGHLGEVERLLVVLQKHRADDEATLQLQLELGREYLERNQRERGFDFLLALEKEFPERDQGRLAKQLLNKVYPKSLG